MPLMPTHAIAVAKWTKFQEAVATAAATEIYPISVKLADGSVYYASVPGTVVADALQAQNTARLWDEVVRSGASEITNHDLGRAAE